MKQALVAVILALGMTSMAEARTHTIVIDKMKFQTLALSVAKGDTVTWVNKDVVPHNVVAGDKSFKSPVLEKGKSWSYTFDHEGGFDYVCTLHPMMKGKVVVK